MQNENNNFIPKYFAAANSYNGFISFFDSIFKPEDFAMIYILKGGPGTGKSSLMKNVSGYFHNQNYLVEEIYCSSDPKSLDAVIVEKENKKIAIIDGTAPHEKDARIPMAFDKIINLADNLNQDVLLYQRSEIISLAKQKSNVYQTAYFYLSAAGKFDSFIRECYNHNFNKNKTKIKADEYLKEILPALEPKCETRLISSFGRRGEVKLNTLKEQKLRLVKVGGSDYSAALLLNCFKENLCLKNQKLTLFPFSLNPNFLDGILIPDYSLAIIKDDDFDINADEFVNIPPTEFEEIRCAKMLRVDSLNEAVRWFSIASDLHFRLEKIYGEAMDFEKNNEIASEIINEITTLMEKEI